MRPCAFSTVVLVTSSAAGAVRKTAHGVDGDQRTFELTVLGELVEKFRNGGDLVGLLRNGKLRQGQLCGRGVGAEGVQGLEPLAMIIGAARRLSVDGDELVPAQPQSRYPCLLYTSDAADDLT